MRTPEEIVRRVTARVDDTWAAVVTAETISVMGATSGTCDRSAGDDVVVAWPHTFPLGRLTSAALGANFGERLRAIHAWRDWAAANGTRLEHEIRHVGGTEQHIPTHVVVPDLDTAARIAGGHWPDILAVGRRRAATILRRFPHTANVAKVLRPVVRLTDLDFDILCHVADWFGQNPQAAAAGLTPRQVPVEGVHAKWLNTNQQLVVALAGLEDLGLLPGHPPRIHFTYLDPAYLVGGGRRHDCYSVGDAVTLPYTPRVVIISENKDTAVGFGPVEGGVAVEGAGTGGGTIAAVPWVRNAPVVVYWGDMDIDGLQILDGFRVAGVDAVSMFMDTDAYATYARFGTNTDPKGRALKAGPAREVTRLRDGELKLYRLLTSGQAPVLRVEQERIPLRTAAAELASIVEGHTVAEPAVLSGRVPSPRQ